MYAPGVPLSVVQALNVSDVPPSSSTQFAVALDFACTGFTWFSPQTKNQATG